MNDKKPAGSRKETENENSVVGITLYPDDKDCIETIKKAHGLIRDTDCIRLALRQTARSLNAEQTA